MSDQVLPEQSQNGGITTPVLDDISNDTNHRQTETPVLEQLIKDAPRDTVPANESSQKDKNGIYKNLAIKLKKELLKTRDELNHIREEYRTEKDRLQTEVETLSKDLDFEKLVRTNTDATREATIRNLRNQLEIAENELQSVQKDFDSYKLRATKILQQANSVQSNSDRSIEEERMKQLRILNSEQSELLSQLRKQLEAITSEKDKLKDEFASVSQRLEMADHQVENIRALNETLSVDNENLRMRIEKINSKSRVKEWNESPTRKEGSLAAEPTEATTSETETSIRVEDDETAEDSNTNSNSSVESSSCSYVHIKPTTFEIVSRSSALASAQNQIDHLTKAYLDSESTNSLLREQIGVLKEEIRRIQRADERMELANNLEYLKNILFKFLALDSSQIEQKQRLVPVLSTVLKLSPDETNKLNTIATADKTTIASSFFKL